MKMSDSEPALDDPSSHDIEQRADTWFFKVIVRLENGRDFSEVLNARAAAGAWPFNCLGHFSELFFDIVLEKYYSLFFLYFSIL